MLGIPLRIFPCNGYEGANVNNNNIIIRRQSFEMRSKGKLRNGSCYKQQELTVNFVRKDLLDIYNLVKMWMLWRDYMMRL